MSETRNCEQCGTAFTPRREHARFCSARCRVAWNRADRAGPPAEASALQWAITAMHDTTDRLPRARGLDRPRAFALISEAVWWVTIVDGTLVRYHPDAYDKALASHPPAERQAIEDTLGGLRFVRNQMGPDVDHVDFICPRAGEQRAAAGRPGANGASHNGAGASRAGATRSQATRVTDWTWTARPLPDIASLSPRAHEWEMTRHQAYQAQLAGRPVGETFRRAAAFLELAASATPAAPAGAN
jgi:hypothetical protein